MKIAYMVGGLSKESHNQGLGKFIAANPPEGVEFVELNIRDLPLYNRDFDADYPQVARDLKNAVEDADGLLIITPEHNRMYSAAIANALEWLSRPWGKASLKRKPVYIAGTAMGPIGTAVAQAHLRATVGFQDALVMNQPELYLDYTKFGINADGTVDNESTQEFIKGAMATFAAFIAEHGNKDQQTRSEM